MEFLAVLFFGLFCMMLGFYGGYMLSENKNLTLLRLIEVQNLTEIIAQYEDDETRYGLERLYQGEHEDN